MKNEITLYPSNWFYNSSVIGFLKILEYIGIPFTFPNGSNGVSFDAFYLKEAFEALNDYYKNELGEKELSIIGNESPYPNYIQYKQEEFFKTHYLDSLRNVQVKSIKDIAKCAFCEGYYIPDNDIQNLETIFKSKNKNADFQKFMRSRVVFQYAHTPSLGPAPTKFPNAFWNLESSVPICHLCSFLVLFRRIAFTESEIGKVFVNASSFKLMWELNTFVSKVLRKNRRQDVKKILGASLLHWAHKRSALLGIWSMQSIEVIVETGHEKQQNQSHGPSSLASQQVETGHEKQQNRIEQYSLPVGVAEILSDYDIANIIKTINDDSVLNIILDGKFCELELLNYLALRYSLTGPDENNTFLERYVKKSNLNKEHLQKLSKYLPKLICKITNKLSKLTMEDNMEEVINTVKPQEIDEMIDSLYLSGRYISPEVAKGIEGIIYHLLEFIRFERYEEVYYMLLRCFEASGSKIPEKLVKAFKPQYSEYFKVLMYSFLSGIINRLEEVNKKEDVNNEE